jgi:hypothetical protein
MPPLLSPGFDGVENGSIRGEFQRPVEALALGGQGTRMDPDFPRMNTDLN